MAARNEHVEKVTQLEIECRQHQIHIKSDMNEAKWGCLGGRVQCS